MSDFIQQITNFQSYGVYNYQFDEVGNEILNPSSSVFQENYISFPTSNYVYDENKILSFYNPKLTEFIPTNVTSSTALLPQEIIDQVNQLTETNLTLQNQLKTLISNSEISSTSADQQAIKDIILGLRIQMNQGKSTIDFNSTFPYLPLPIENRIL